MSTVETVLVSDGGDVPIPPSLRQLTGIESGSVVTLEARDGTIVIRPVSEAVEVYTPERKAEFLLSNAVDPADYAAACEEVRKLGLDPDAVLHGRPNGRDS
jgi:bifunctional DNA-binding transcriptional regulator/antitoxin component of YhaV-PrlF toxin-antitoxin module